MHSLLIASSLMLCCRAMATQLTHSTGRHQQGATPASPAACRALTWPMMTGRSKGLARVNTHPGRDGAEVAGPLGMTLAQPLNHHQLELAQNA